MKSLFWSCLGRLVWASIVFGLGLVCGAWLGVNLVERYPGIEFPEIPILETALNSIPIYARSARASDGLLIYILDVNREGQRVSIHLNLENGGARPFEPRMGGFFLTDSQGRMYVGTWLPVRNNSDMWNFSISFGNLNPGIARQVDLSFAVPPNARNLRLNYKDAILSLGW